MDELQKYVIEYHTTGLVWNAKVNMMAHTIPLYLFMTVRGSRPANTSQPDLLPQRLEPRLHLHHPDLHLRPLLLHLRLQ